MTILLRLQAFGQGIIRIGCFLSPLFGTSARKTQMSRGWNHLEASSPPWARMLRRLGLAETLGRAPHMPFHVAAPCMLGSQRVSWEGGFREGFAAVGVFQDKKGKLHGLLEPSLGNHIVSLVPYSTRQSSQKPLQIQGRRHGPRFLMGSGMSMNLQPFKKTAAVLM